MFNSKLFTIICKLALILLETISTKRFINSLVKNESIDLSGSVTAEQ